MSELYELRHDTFSIFSTRDLFHRHSRFTGQQGKGGDHLLFPSTSSTRSRTFKHLFSTLHLRWLSSMFNHNACIYQTATRWDLPFYWTSISLIDDAIFVCLLDSLILGFCYSNLTRKSGISELKLTITLVLQANRISKYAGNYTFTLHVSSFNCNKESKEES